MLKSRRLGAVLAIAGVATIGIMALPGKAEAWWRGGFCCGVGFGVVIPPVVVAPPYYAPAPVLPTAAHVLRAADCLLRAAAASMDTAALAGRRLGARPLGLIAIHRCVPRAAWPSSRAVC